jgi:hypothetical protein
LAALLASVPQAGEQTKTPVMPYPPRDAERPIPLPVLGKYEPDKAGKNDPVAEASKSMVGNVIVTARPQPAPFVRQVVPDPFENRNLVRVPNPVPEDPVLPLVLPRK